MLNITLPDGKKLTFEKKVSGIKIAEKISKSLAKEALLMICLFFRQLLNQLHFFQNLFVFRLVK